MLFINHNIFSASSFYSHTFIAIEIIDTAAAAATATRKQTDVLNPNSFHSYTHKHRFHAHPKFDPKKNLTQNIKFVVVVVFSLYASNIKKTN